MIRRGLRVLLVGAAIAASANAASQAVPATHGMADGFAAPGVVLAWAVARGAGGADATVVIRVTTDRARYAALAVTGVDPFTQATKAVLAATPVSGSIDVAVPRAHFADFPRTELRLFATDAAMRAGTPALVVYYLGVPDTTPEFAGKAALESYLADRIARLSSMPPGKPP